LHEDPGDPGVSLLSTRTYRKTGSHLDVNQLPDALPEHLLAALEQERVKKRRIRDREYNRRSRQKKKQEKMAALAGSSHEDIQHSQGAPSVEDINFSFLT
ncbi:hypothetical protein PMAYCL1PPCAC_27281, partial [Pristionchus mayeri]